MEEKAVALKAADLERYLKKIPEDANKGTSGTLTTVAGSVGFRGAAVLCVSGALRSGTGIVRLVSVEKAVAATCVSYPSATFVPVPEDGDGFVSLAAAEAVERYKEKTSAFLIGCGLGQGEGGRAALKAVLGIGKPAVLDADALNLISREPELWSEASAPLIITPHVGEMSRLCGKEISEIKSKREETAAEFSGKHGVVTVLKDHVTVISDAGGNLYSCSLGSPGLAKGGSGDVLAGVIAGLLASGHDPTSAAIAGVLMHALASVRCAEAYGVRGMLPSDLAGFLR